MTMTMTTATAQATRGFMLASETVALFKRGLDEELGLATAARFDHDDAGDERAARVFEAMYLVAAQLDPDATTVPGEVIAINTEGFCDVDRHAVVLMLKVLAPHRMIVSTAAASLEAIGAPVNAATIRDASVQLLKAKAEAQARSALLTHSAIAVSANPMSRLLDDNIVAGIRTSMSTPSTSASGLNIGTDQAQTMPFLIRDERRISEVIDQIIASIQRSGDWNEDIEQRRRVVRSFVWITGDKRLCDYGPRDPELFAETLTLLPSCFKWGTLESGNMSRPFAEVMRDASQLQGKKRHVRTLNRDLTTLSRFGRELMKTAWKPRYGKEPVVDFAGFGGATPVDDPDDPDRMPYTDEQLVTLFSSPIYTGGGGCSRRLKAVPNGPVYQDAAYWVPLLLTYGVMSREEACGIECEDFVFDVKTPFLAVVQNLTKSKDGLKPAGLKRPSRRRMIPLHPELLRLGLRNYIARIEAEEQRMAFPELYQEHIKKGGVRFYASAGRYIISYVDEINPLLQTSSGKRADLHSLRTTGGSALEDSDAKQLVVNDIMGHAREGTGPRKYSKAWFAKGGGEILASRLKTMVAALPLVTDHVKSAPVSLLPLAERSRTGSATVCVSRKKA